MFILVYICANCTLKDKGGDGREYVQALVSEMAMSTRSSSRAGGDGVNYYRLGGNIAGLSGIIYLQNNAAEQAPFNISGRFTFPQSYPDGGNYAISVSVHPSGQECSVSNGFGRIVSKDISDVIVNCVTK
ncbi:hypothetical protein EHS15_15670 [Leptospira idonii]|uniref:Uncharacterized protein n=1 Tax=Leptospira idonii TaxID=1193500 RepID=A0A4R9LV40_9LEPT|nr:hypothetical protein EHS15_15670 [Leptospira idonii]